MKQICLCFQIHHPFFCQTFRFLDIGESKSYFDDTRIERVIHEASAQIYLPANDFLLKLIKRSKRKLKLSFYISGTALDQFLMHSPQVIDSFRKLADTGQVEFIGGTDSHSIVSLDQNTDEFKLQIKRHRERITNYFGRKPEVFVNTDLLYTSKIAGIVAKTGYQTMITNGTKRLLQWRSPNYLYSDERQKDLRILLRNEGISNKLTSILMNSIAIDGKQEITSLIKSLNSIDSSEPFINIYLNYNTLGYSEINSMQLDFNAFTSAIIKDQTYSFILPSELAEQFGSISEIGSEEPNCWVEHFHSSYYPGNELQKDAMKHLFKLQKHLSLIKNPNIKIDFQYLQTSDHFHLMDENHPAYHENNSVQSIFRSKYDAYINYMNILEDFRQRLQIAKSFNRIHSSTKIVQKHIY